MVIAPIQADLARLLGDHQQSVQRSPGLHVSHVIKDICRTMDPGRFKGGDGLPDTPTVELGLLFESVLEQAMANRALSNPDLHIVRVGEVTLDGITGSPDGIYLPESDEPVLGEFKLTWMSSRGTDTPDGIQAPKFWHWWVQIKAYCWMLEMDRAVLSVLFVNGDYGANRFPPLFRQWEASFDPSELASNWSMITSHARARGWL